MGPLPVDSIASTWAAGRPLRDALAACNNVRLVRADRAYAFGRPTLTMPGPLTIFDHIAAGDAAGCAAALARGASWALTDEDGTTPLESAVRAGNVEITRLILGAGAPPSSALFVALWSYNDRTPDTAASVLEALLQAGADPNWRNDDGSPALYQCVKHPPLARVLLAHGAAPNSTTSAGESPLSFACDWGLLGSVELLLDASADPRQAVPELDWPPLFFAAQGGHVEIARALLDAGVDPEWANERGQSALDVALDHGRGALAHLLLDRQPGLASGDVKARAAEARRKTDERLARRIEALARRSGQGADSLHECRRALGRARAALGPTPEPYALVSAEADESSRLRRWALRFKPRAWLPTDDEMRPRPAGGGVIVRVELDGDTTVSHDDLGYDVSASRSRTASAPASRRRRRVCEAVGGPPDPLCELALFLVDRQGEGHDAALREAGDEGLADGGAGGDQGGEGGGDPIGDERFIKARASVVRSGVVALGFSEIVRLGRVTASAPEPHKRRHQPPGCARGRRRVRRASCP